MLGRRALLVGLMCCCGLGLAACSSGGSASGGGSSTTGIPGGGPTLSSLTSSVKGQLVGSGKGNFDVSGVSKVICNPPNTWHPGDKFTCFVYNSSSNEIGTYTGTIEPDTTGEWQWNAAWDPNS